jgi:hypothetical protein
MREYGRKKSAEGKHRRAYDRERKARKRKRRREKNSVLSKGKNGESMSGLQRRLHNWTAPVR